MSQPATHIIQPQPSKQQKLMNQLPTRFQTVNSAQNAPDSSGFNFQSDIRSHSTPLISINSLKVPPQITSKSAKDIEILKQQLPPNSLETLSAYSNNNIHNSGNHLINTLNPPMNPVFYSQTQSQHPIPNSFLSKQQNSANIIDTNFDLNNNDLNNLNQASIKLGQNMVSNQNIQPDLQQQQLELQHQVDSSQPQKLFIKIQPKPQATADPSMISNNTNNNLALSSNTKNTKSSKSASTKTNDVKPSQVVVVLTPPISNKANTSITSNATAKNATPNKSSKSKATASKTDQSLPNQTPQSLKSKHIKEPILRTVPELYQESMKEFIEEAQLSSKLQFSNEIRKKYETTKESIDRQTANEDIDINNWHLLFPDRSKLFEMTLIGHLVKAIRYLNDKAPLGFLIEVTKPFLMTSLRRKNGKIFEQGDNERIIKGALAEFCFQKLDINSEIWTIDEDRIDRVLEETNIKVNKYFDSLCKSKGKAQQSIICNNNLIDPTAQDSHSYGDHTSKTSKKKQEKLKSKQQQKDQNQQAKGITGDLIPLISDGFEDNDFNLNQISLPLPQLQLQQQQSTNSVIFNTEFAPNTNTFMSSNNNQRQDNILQQPSQGNFRLGSSIKQEDIFNSNSTDQQQQLFSHSHSVKIEAATERQRKHSLNHRMSDTSEFSVNEVIGSQAKPDLNRTQQLKTALYRSSGTVTPSTTNGAHNGAASNLTGINTNPNTAPTITGNGMNNNYLIPSPSLVEPFTFQEEDNAQQQQLQQQHQQYSTKKKPVMVQEDKMKKVRRYMDKFAKENSANINREETLKKLESLGELNEEQVYKELNEMDNYFILGMTVCFAVFKDKLNMNLNHILESRDEEYRKFNQKKKILKGLVQYI